MVPVGDDALHLTAVGVPQPAFNELLGGQSHAHGLLLQPFADTAPAAVDDRADTDFDSGFQINPSFLQSRFGYCQLSELYWIYAEIYSRILKENSIILSHYLILSYFGGANETALAGREYEKLRRLLMDYYEVTGQRIGVFDADFHILMAYPEPHCALCSWLRSSETGARRCREWDNHGMREAKRTGQPVVYRCHAGLLEVCVPLQERGGRRSGI